MQNDTLSTRLSSMQDLVKLKQVAPHDPFHFDDNVFTFLDIDPHTVSLGEHVVLADTSTGKIIRQHDKAEQHNATHVPLDDFISQIGVAPEKHMPKIVLIDLDDTTLDFEGMKASRRHLHPFPQSQPGFYRNLPLLPGAYDAICAIENDPRYVVYFCTAPSRVPQNAFCLTEKAESVINIFGEKFHPRLITAMDKSMVKGDILIDNLPAGRGQERFDGELIVYHPENNPWPAIVDKLDVHERYRVPLRDTLPDYLP